MGKKWKERQWVSHLPRLVSEATLLCVDLCLRRLILPNHHIPHFPKSYIRKTFHATSVTVTVCIHGI